MGFLAIFKFGLICLDALAWPLFALGYPLLASIHAIETNSYSDMVKLVTYWVIFSLISLFEHAFMGMHQWLPFWPYMKLTITCWMVIPHFDGALYVYNHFVNPCLNVHMQSISNSFNKFQRFFLKLHFLADADNDVKGLEKPIASESKGTNSSILQDDLKAVQVKEKKEVGPVNLDLSKGPNSSILQNDMKAVQVTEKKDVGPVNLIPEIESNAAANTMNGVLEVPEMNNIPSGTQQVQKEWTCAMCQVTTSSETTLNSHLQGRRHWDTWQELMKAKNSNLPTSNTSNTSKAVNPNARRSKSNPLKDKPNKSFPNNSEGNQVKLQQKVGKKPQFRCTICNIYCGRPEDLDCHLWGKKHLTRIQELHSFARGEPA